MCKFFFFNHLTVDDDSFTNVSNVWRCVFPNGVPITPKHRGEHFNSGALANCSRNMHHLDLILWVAEFVENVTHSIKFECIFVVLNDPHSLEIGLIKKVRNSRGKGFNGLFFRLGCLFRGTLLRCCFCGSHSGQILPYF